MRKNNLLLTTVVVMLLTLVNQTVKAQTQSFRDAVTKLVEASLTQDAKDQMTNGVSMMWKAVLDSKGDESGMSADERQKFSSFVGKKYGEERVSDFMTDIFMAELNGKVTQQEVEDVTKDRSTDLFKKAKKLDEKAKALLVAQMNNAFLTGKELMLESKVACSESYKTKFNKICELTGGNPEELKNTLTAMVKSMKGNDVDEKTLKILDEVADNVSLVMRDEYVGNVSEQELDTLISYMSKPANAILTKSSLNIMSDPQAFGMRIFQDVVDWLTKNEQRLDAEYEKTK